MNYFIDPIDDLDLGKNALRPAAMAAKERAARSRVPALVLGFVLIATTAAGCGVAEPGTPGGSCVGQDCALSSQSGLGLSGAKLTASHLCDMPPPAGATVAPAPPVYKGTCPRLVPGKNTIWTSLFPRNFQLVVPAHLDPMEKLPVIFLWHWLGGSADEFIRKGEVQNAVDSQRFLAIVPEAKFDMIFKWPFDVGVSAARQEEEYRFFDDMLACAAAQFNVNNNCVASAGVSAGALFTDQLAGARGQYLSSALSLSGGVGGGVKPWGKPAHKLPMIVLWGGPTDNCLGVIRFNVISKTLEDELTRDGHFLVECVHNCGHAEPPFETPAMLSKYAGLWDFVLDHPYWLKAGESPYKTSGLPSDMPSFCAIGAGSATPRTGVCPDKPGC